MLATQRRDRPMNLTVPMRIVSLDGPVACCEARGVRCDVSLALLRDQALRVGDYVFVQEGYALQTITEAYAAAAWDLLDQAWRSNAPSRAASA